MERSTLNINTTAARYLNCGKRIRPANPYNHGTAEWNRFEISSQAMHNQILKYGDWPDQKTYSAKEVKFVPVTETSRRMYLNKDTKKLYFREESEEVTVAVYQN